MSKSEGCLKIDIIVGGRFHADHMALALLRAKHDVHLFTSLPKSRFPEFPPERITSILLPEIVFRLAGKLGAENRGDLFKMRAFGRAAARKSRHPDVIISWSSFALESFRENPNALKILVRDNSHIETQLGLYAREYSKLNLAVSDRSVCIARELEEYRLADRIQTCSEYARESFLKRGFADEKIKSISLGVNTSVFRAKASFEVKLPLRVVYFGRIAIAKGVHFLLEAAKDFRSDELKLTLVGPVHEQFKPFLEKYPHVRICPPLPHAELAKLLQLQDVFVLPTLEDGFGMVVPQAMASGLACIVSEDCGAKGLIRDGQNGFVVPTGDVGALKKLLQDLVSNPQLVESIGRQASASGLNHSWEVYKNEVAEWIATLEASRNAVSPASRRAIPQSA